MTKRLSLLALLPLFCACSAADAPPASPPPDANEAFSAAELGAPSLRGLERRVLGGDVAEWSAELPIGDGKIRVHRVTRELAPFVARPTPQALMLLHGDFSTFDTNFAEGLALYLAGRDVDVWGFDRRWTLLPEGTTDFSSLAGQGFGQAVGDAEQALLAARTLRAFEGAGRAPLALGGFSRGAHLAYALAAADAARTPPSRLVRALLPIDAFYVGPPEVHDAVCALAAASRAALEAGPQTENTLFPLVVTLAQQAPDEPSPIVDGLSNRQAFLTLASETHLFYNPTPAYHLFAPGLPFTAEPRVAGWLLGAPPFQALPEVLDSETLWCEGSLESLAAVKVPVLYVGAAGGFGDFARPTVDALGSADKTTLLVRVTGDDATDIGHADLLFADDAPALVWGAMADWLRHH